MLNSPTSKAVVAATALIVTSHTASAQSLTRIEPHGFYGATVTVEAGVRVFRALPPTNVMIINPGNRTPVSVNVMTDTRPPAPVIVDQGGGAPIGSPYLSGGGGDPGWSYYRVGGFGYGHRNAFGGGGRPVKHVAAKPGRRGGAHVHR